MLLSIVIPAYNCSPVIIRCLDSIDYPDAEIIVVDDGSTDGLSIIVSEYSQNHPNVTLIQKDNGGVSSARNLGIESASGKYIMFVDADDYLVPGGISRIVELAESSNADVVTYRIISVMNNDSIDICPIDTYPITSKRVNGAGEALLRYDVPDFHVVDALFRLSCIIDNNIRFSTQLSIREDDVFCGMLFCHTNSIVVTDLPLYRYVRSSSYSSTHNTSLEKQRKLISSSYLAMRIRGDYVKEHIPEAMSHERMKYMRWVCFPTTAFEYGYSLHDYSLVLKEYEKIGCWPLDYNWFHIAGLDCSLKMRVKNRIKTFLCNNPKMAYIILNLCKRR